MQSGPKRGCSLAPALTTTRVGAQVMAKTGSITNDAYMMKLTRAERGEQRCGFAWRYVKFTALLIRLFAMAP
jgi:hypothetical protein